MKKYSTSVDGKQFDEFILACMGVHMPGITEVEQIKTAILYQVFFYALFKSGILVKRDTLFTQDSRLLIKKYPEQFIVSDSENIQELFLPELFEKVSEFINHNLVDYPLYLLSGVFYENLLTRILTLKPDRVIYDKQFVKSKGIFYTPWPTAEIFIKGLFDHFDIKERKISDIKVLDLACGCGVFSILILKILSEMIVAKIEKEDRENGSKIEGIVKEQFYKSVSTVAKLSILKNNISTIDSDKTSLEISKCSLLLFSLIHEKNIISIAEFARLCSILKNNHLNANIIDLYKNTSAEHGHESKFDIIVSNPPYLAYYSRHSKSDHDFQKDLPAIKQSLVYFKDFYNTKKSGRMNSIIFFIDYAIRFLSPNGDFAFVTDMNIHEPLFKEIRNWVLENLTLLETRINVCDFPGVNSGQSFIYLRNKKPNDENSIKIIDHRNNETSYIKQPALKKNSSFFLKKNSKLLEQFEQLPVLGKFCRISTGVNIGGVSELFLADHNGTGAFYPMITPAQLKYPYAEIFSNGRLFINFNREKAASLNREFRDSHKNTVIALGKLQRFLEPKIFVRQSAPRIIAAYSEKAVVSPYSIFVINQTGKFDLFVLLAILNSDLISFYCIKKGLIRHGSGKQPQIRKVSLELIPVPDADQYSAYKPEIEKNVKQLMANIETETGADKAEKMDLTVCEDANRHPPKNNRSKASLPCVFLKEEIEKLVCSMYKIDYDAFQAEKTLVL